MMLIWSCIYDCSQSSQKLHCLRKDREVNIMLEMPIRKGTLRKFPLLGWIACGKKKHWISSTCKSKQDWTQRCIMHNGKGFSRTGRSKYEIAPHLLSIDLFLPAALWVESLSLSRLQEHAADVRLCDEVAGQWRLRHHDRWRVHFACCLFPPVGRFSCEANPCEDACFSIVLLRSSPGMISKA